MGKIIDMKFKDADFVGKLVSELPDDPSEAGFSAEKLKGYFDALPKALIALQKLNPFFDLLESAEASGSIGALLTNGTASNLQAALHELKTISDNKDANLSELAGIGRSTETVVGAYQKVVDHANELLTQAGASKIGVKKLYADDISGNTVYDKLVKLAQMVVEIDKFTPRGIISNQSGLPQTGNAYGDFFYIRTADSQVFEEWVWINPPQWQYYGNVSLHILSSKADKDLLNVTNSAFKSKAEGAQISAGKIVFNNTGTPIKAIDVESALREVNTTVTTAILPWTAVRIYGINELCYKDGMIYKSLQADNTGQVVTDGAWWVRITQDQGGGGYEQLVNYQLLYDLGNEHGDVTGGIVNGFKGSDGANTFIKNNNNIAISSIAPTSAAGTGITADTAQAINMDRYTSLNVVIDVISSKWISVGGNIALNAGVNNNTEITPQTPNTLAVRPGTGKRVLQLPIANVGAKHARIGGYLGINDSVAFNLYAMYLLKPDDYQTLCQKANVPAPANLAALIADTTKLTTIFSNADTVAYMAARCTGDFMAGVLADTAAKTALKASPHINKVVANPHWARFIMLLAPDLLGYTTMYDKGDENIPITGGLSLWGRAASGATYWPTLTKNTDNLTFISESSKNGSIATVNKIDLQAYAGIYAVAEITRLNTGPEDLINRCVLVGISPTRVNGSEGAEASMVGIVGADCTIGRCTIKYTLGILTDHSQFVVVCGHRLDSKWYNIVLVKSDNYQQWLTTAGLNHSSYANLDAVLADSTALATLMASKAAIEYMLGCTGDLMFATLNSTAAVNAIKANTETVMRVTGHPCYKHFIDALPVPIAAGLNLLGGA